MRQGTVPGGKPLRDGVLALAFHTLLSFQGTSPGCSSATHLRFPGRSPPERRGRYHGLSRSSKTSHLPGQRTPGGAPPATPTPSHRSAALRPEPSGRQDGHRTAVGLTPSGARRPPVFRCRRRGRRPGEVLGLEELPCLQLGDGSTAFDTVSTCPCCWTPATTTVPGGLGVSPSTTAPGGPVFPGRLQDRRVSSVTWSRSGERRPTVSRRPSSS